LNRPLPFGPRAQVMLKESSLATEGLKKVNMSGAEEQCVVNVQNAMKHPKYNPNVDGKDTVSSLLVPIAKVTGERDIICVLQLRNKQPKNVHTPRSRPVPRRASAPTTSISCNTSRSSAATSLRKHSSWRRPRRRTSISSSPSTR